MSMLLKLADGTSLQPIPDQTLDTVQTSIALIGKGWIGYTEPWNQNLLAMLGNFASVAQPARPLTGQLWFDKNVPGLRLQIGAGKPEVDPQLGAGWSAPLLTAGTTLAFSNASSDIVVPAVGTIAMPPALILKNVNALASNTTGTFNTVTVNAKGLVVAGYSAGYLSDMVMTGDASGHSIGNALNLTLSTINPNPGSFNTVVVNAKGLVVSGAYVNYVTGSQGLTLSGDATGSGPLAANVAVTLATVNSNVGTFNTVTVNAKGLVTSATNAPYASTSGDPCTTVTLTADYTITDAAPIYVLTINANATITLNVPVDSTHPTYAKSLTVALIGDGTHSASFAATTPASIVWDMGPALPMNTARNKTSIFTFLYLPGTTKWFAGRAMCEA